MEDLPLDVVVHEIMFRVYDGLTWGFPRDAS